MSDGSYMDKQPSWRRIRSSGMYDGSDMNKQPSWTGIRNSGMSDGSEMNKQPSWTGIRSSGLCDGSDMNKEPSWTGIRSSGLCDGSDMNKQPSWTGIGNSGLCDGSDMNKEPSWTGIRSSEMYGGSYMDNRPSWTGIRSSGLCDGSDMNKRPSWTGIGNSGLCDGSDMNKEPSWTGIRSSDMYGGSDMNKQPSWTGIRNSGLCDGSYMNKQPSWTGIRYSGLCDGSEMNKQPSWTGIRSSGLCDGSHMNKQPSWTGIRSSGMYDGSHMNNQPSWTGIGRSEMGDGSYMNKQASWTGISSMKNYCSGSVTNIKTEAVDAELGTCCDGSNMGKLSSLRGKRSLIRVDGNGMQPCIRNLKRCADNADKKTCYAVEHTSQSREGFTHVSECYTKNSVAQLPMSSVSAKKMCYPFDHREADFVCNPDSYARNSTEFSNPMTLHSVSAKHHFFPTDIKIEKNPYSQGTEDCQAAGTSKMGMESGGIFMGLQAAVIPHTEHLNHYDAVGNTFVLPTRSATSFNPSYNSFCDISASHLSVRKPRKISGTSNSCRLSSSMDSEDKRYYNNQGIHLFQCSLDHTESIANKFILIEKWQCQKLREITLPDKVAYVYNPLEYAFETHYDFISKFCNSEKHILFLGMNPGPWGMSQNGVPFGECDIVRNWLGVKGSVSKPNREHPKRPILGLDCKRSEVSGSRFWGLFRDLCKTPETFFRTCFVYNLCPLAFMTDTAKNITPPQLTSATLLHVDSVCDEALLRVIRLLNIRIIIGIGKYAYNRALKLVTSSNISVSVEQIMHPSPINPAANKGWSEIVRKQLLDNGLLNIITQNGEIK